MRISVAMVGVGAALCLAATPVSAIASKAPHSPTAAPLVATVVADWEMNEPAGATVMTDSSGHGLTGNITEPNSELQTGVTFDASSTGYHWVRRAPNAPPAVPARIIQVPDNDQLDPTDPAVTYTLSIRYRTKENFGNIIQKGQSASKGGQIKIQNPMGMPSCLFKGALGRVATQSKVALNDNTWHVLTCVKTATRVTLLIDGVENNHHNGQTGVINNKIPYTVGGKINCDQISVTCDYFSGDIDWVKITKG